ncbi:MAG TPA: saccharopine dehydrogenase C-terminal domain-containing protein [Bacteroidota bacterium]|nr:saccharopine dehydrogenase C-terminal domain-containing protein [Bacteroidota bacterium]
MPTRKPFLVLGAGLMGNAIAYDLIHSSPHYAVTLADLDGERARQTASALDMDRAHPQRIDVRNFDDVVRLMAGHSVVISAVTFHLNLLLAKAAIKAGAHFCDLGHDDGIIQQQLAEASRASDAKITAVVNCGLAPGLADILAMHAFRQFENVDSLQLRVGGLPQHPHPPFNYQLVFSAEGLVEEYSLPATILRGGKIMTVESLTEVEELSFPPPFQNLEAFHTGGGASRLPHLLEGKVESLEYKTIRYAGHCEKIKPLFDIGFAENTPLALGSNLVTTRELFLELLKKRLTFNEPDVVLILVTARGKQGGKERQRSYRVIDLFDEKNSMTAMMRTTSFPTSVIAQMLLDGTISEKGVFTAEEIVPAEPLIAELKKRNIIIESLDN